jgi:hypothetical protein
MIENVLMTAFWLLFAHALVISPSRLGGYRTISIIYPSYASPLYYLDRMYLFLPSIMSMIAAWKIAFYFFGHF